jgi:hypothetical protein
MLTDYERAQAESFWPSVGAIRERLHEADPRDVEAWIRERAALERARS